MPSGSFRAADRVRFGMRLEVSRVENGFVWREGRVVKERVTAWDALRLARAESFAGRRGRRVLFANMRVSKRRDWASMIAGTPSYDTIERAAGFGLGNV